MTQPRDEDVDWEFTYTEDGSPRRTFWEDEHPKDPDPAGEDEGYHG